MKKIRLLLMLLTISCVTTVANAAEPALVNTGQVQRVGETVTLPGLIVRGGAHPFVEAAGSISVTNGILEFVAVEPKGRDYESFLTLTCQPSALKFALLLIGCEPAPADALTKEKPGSRIGDRLRLEVEWQSNGKPKRVPLDQLMLDRRTKKPPTNLAWHFVGSYFTKSVINDQDIFLSDAEQAHIALWWSPAVLINLIGEHGNPYRGEDQGFEVNEAVVPAKDTPVKLILQKYK
jgi:hypothetical protein